MAGSYLVSWLWDFGDGSTSTDKNPVHTFRMPGIYTVRLTVINNYGDEFTTSETVYVYDFDYTFSGLYLSEPDYCFKYAHKNTQGSGISEYGGDHWVRPVAVTGTVKGFDDNNEPVSLVLDHRTQNIYRLGVAEVWKDAKDSYGGYDIAGRIKLPENTSRAGEFETIRHKETHLGIRPWNEEYKGADGYNDDGFLPTQQFSLKGYSDGNLTHEVKLNDLIRKGDYVFNKEFQNNRLQLEFITSASAWRLATVQTHLQEIDRMALPQLNYTVEKQYQAEYRGVDFWLSKNKPSPLMDRATAQLLTGSYDQTLTGPDGKSGTALAFNAIGGVEALLAYVISDFSLSFWLSQLITVPGMIWRFDVQGGGQCSITITYSAGTYNCVLSDGVDTATQPLEWDGISWVLITLERSGSSLLIYENGTLRGTHDLSGVRGYGGNSLFCYHCDVVTFDARRVHANAISRNAIVYYYDDVINNSGAGGILP